MVTFQYKGNIDLYNRPRVRMSDGSIATIRSSSFNIDGKEILLPTVSPEGVLLSDDEAIALYKETGQHLGIYDTIDEANAAGEQLHLQQQEYYTGGKMHPLNAKGYELTPAQEFELQLSAQNDFSSIITTLAGGFAKMRSYSFEANQAQYNAEILKQNINDILQASYDYENKVREEGLKVRGEQRAAMSASGFDVDSKSYKDVIGQTDYKIARNTAAIRREAMTKYTAGMAKSKMTQIQGKMYKKAGKLSAMQAISESVGKGLTGAMKLSMLNKYKASDESLLGNLYGDK